MTITRREQCPKCNDYSEDNLIVYGNGSKHCHACQYHENGEGMTTETAPNIGTQDLVLGTVVGLPTRAISVETCEMWNYRIGRYSGFANGEYLTDAQVHIANYGPPHNVVAQKLRTKDKAFKLLGDTKNLPLYGQWLKEPSEQKSVIVVEGEIDALTLTECMGRDWAIVSVPNGAGSASKELKNHMEWLMGWGTIYLGFDTDEVGQKATQDCSSLFDPSKIRIITWPKKDPNESLVAGDRAGVIQAVHNASSFRPKSIMSPIDIIDDILTEPTIGRSWPWPSLTEMTYGIQPKRIYMFGGGSGLGKTEILLNIIGHLLEVEKVKVGTMFLESTTGEICQRLAGYYLNQRLHVPGVQYDKEEVKRAIEGFNDKIFLYDAGVEGVTGCTWEQVKNKIIYMCKGLGVRYIILDHLTALASHMKDERKELDKCMAELAALVHSLDCTIFLISHLAAPQINPNAGPDNNSGKTYEQGREVTGKSFRGSQALQYWPAFIFGVERNPSADSLEERKTIKLRVIKDRLTGESTGRVVMLKYNRENGKLQEPQQMGGDI